MHTSFGYWLYKLTAIGAWLAGIALAKGALSTIGAIIFPPWAWYVFVATLVTKL